jgi:hypothetical protein
MEMHPSGPLDRSELFHPYLKRKQAIGGALALV